MRNSVVLSVLFHVAIMLVAMFGLPWSPPEPPILNEPVLLVELAPIAERTNAPPPKPEPPKPEPPKPEPPKPEPPKPEPPKPEPPKPEPPKPEPPKPEPPKPEPPKPEPPKPEPPKPEPKPQSAPLPEPAPKAEPLPKPAEVAPPEPKAKPKPKPEPPKPAFDPSKLAALLDKAPRTPSSTPQPAAPAPQPPQPSAARPAPNAPSNPLAPVTQGERDFLISQIQRNWNLDCGRRDADKIVIRIQALYNPDGSLREQPQILDQGRLLLPGNEGWAAAAQAALRAVLITQPLKFPPGDVGRWSQPFILNFDARAFCGG